MSKDELDTEGQAEAAAAAYPVLTKEIVKEILQSEPPYTNDDERETCWRMVEELTQEEQTTAACTSYAYWFAHSFYSEDADAKPSDEDAVGMAMREARRHLVGSNHDEPAALERLRKTCHFRKVVPVEYSSRQFVFVRALPVSHLQEFFTNSVFHSPGPTHRLVS
jgi:hypothetical protein